MSEQRTTEADRYPTLTESGRGMLEFLREHPHAPIYRNESGNRLTAEDVERVRAFESEMLDAPVEWPGNSVPQWVGDFVAQCFADVPHYRRLGSAPAHLRDVPTITRGDLSRDIAQFVPDSAPVERLINFRTSGTTGHPLLLASEPSVAASYLTFHKRALRRFGVELRHGRGQVGVVLIGWQRRCFTYVSVTPTMDDSGLAKINLHPNDWRDPDDREKYLDALAPEVITGDPISFAALLELRVRCRPRALISTSMTLLPGLRAALQERFGCVVVDLYSLNEAGPIAVADDAVGGHVLLQPRMYVEILARDGDEPVAAGERGEVTLTGGFNSCLPLLRYRTGDYAELRLVGNEPVLIGLEGRPPVLFRTVSGEWLNNIEITHALAKFAIPQFTLHQHRDAALQMSVRGAQADREAVRHVLLELFGASQPLELRELEHTDGKLVQYTSDLSPAVK